MSAMGGTRLAYALTLAGLGLSLLGIAFAVRRVEASELVFWLLIGSVAAIPLFGASVNLAPCRRRRKPRPHLVGPECRRVADAIERLITEQWANLVARNSGIQPAVWREKTEDRYLDDLQEWALGVFDDAVACEALSRNSRPLVKRPRAEQLEKTRDLFREAADFLSPAI